MRLSGFGMDKAGGAWYTMPWVKMDRRDEIRPRKTEDVNRGRSDSQAADQSRAGADGRHRGAGNGAGTHLGASAGRPAGAGTAYAHAGAGSPGADRRASRGRLDRGFRGGHGSDRQGLRYAGQRSGNRARAAGAVVDGGAALPASEGGERAHRAGRRGSVAGRAGRGWARGGHKASEAAFRRHDSRRQRRHDGSAGGGAHSARHADEYHRASGARRSGAVRGNAGEHAGRDDRRQAGRTSPGAVSAGFAFAGRAARAVQDGRNPRAAGSDSEGGRASVRHCPR